MLGREAYHRPEVIAELHACIYRDGWRAPDMGAMIERMAEYAQREVRSGTPLNAITRHMLGLVSGRPGARRYRQLLSAGALSEQQRRADFDAARAAALLREAAACCT
jgi:tRNA-dihydrouridine synthase A